ncbi:MAG: MFS transporter [Chloroflexi bacterium]|nr:MFS transporter [Chloroflexota bacterium]
MASPLETGRPVSKLFIVRNRFGSVRLVALQFLSLGGIGIVWPYVNVFLTDQGFSGTLIGTLGSAGALLSLALTPLFNQIADRLMLHRRLFIIYMGGFALANITFALAPHHTLLVLAVLLSRLTISPSLTLGMQLTITFLLSRGKAVLGQLRSFASLGFTLASLLAGQLFAMGGYPLLFWVAAAIALLTMLSSTIFPEGSKDKAKVEEDGKQPRNRGFYVMAASQFFVSMGTYNMYSFIFIHFNQNLDVASAHIGLWAALMGAVEFPFFFLMDAILPRFRIRVAYIIGMLGTALFAFLLGVVQSTLLLAPLLILRGVVWPCYQLSSFTLVNAISHPRNAATNQAILQVTMPSIALLLTGSLFGWAYDNLGPAPFFSLNALMCAIGACIVIAGFRLFDARQITASA